MFWYLIYNIRGMVLFNQFYSSKISNSSHEIYIINFCSFYNINNSNSDGGALFISTTLPILLCNSFFSNIVISGDFVGGGGCLIGSEITLSYNCFILCSCGYTGFGIYQDSSITNILNHSVFMKCYNQAASSCSSWCLRGGYSTSISLNCSSCTNIYRETCGHFGWNPSCYSCFINNINNNGAFVYFPYSRSPEGIHEFSNYINNSVTHSIIFFSPFDILKNNVFVKNVGTISSQYTGNPTGVLQNCIFDTEFSGIITNTPNCLFLQNNILLNKILISNSLCNNNYLDTIIKKKKLNFQKYYFLFIFL